MIAFLATCWAQLLPVFIFSPRAVFPTFSLLLHVSSICKSSIISNSVHLHWLASMAQLYTHYTCLSCCPYRITETSSRRALTQPRCATVVSHILVLYIMMLLFYYVQFWLVVNMYQTLFMRNYGISIFCWNIPEEIILLVFFFVLNW